MSEKIQVKEQKFDNTHGLLGFVSGMVVGTLLQPLEIVKMGLIIGPENNPQLKQQIKKGNILKNTYLITQHIYSTEGPRGFFRSYIPCILRNGGGSGVYFYTLCELDYLSSKYIKQQNEQQQKKQHFINSALARVTSAIAINPISVIGSRIEVPGFNEYKNMRDGFRQVYQREGMKSFFKGSLASCLKDGPFAGLYLVIYKYIQQKVQEQQSVKLHYATVSMISGMVAGIMATMSSHPLEIIRARLQVSQQAAGQSGIISELRKIYVEEGFYGYFRGITPRLVKKPLANSLTFVGFELIHFNVHQKKW